jgi:HAD superfamily hydrolase (TIGR01509 family)
MPIKAVIFDYDGVIANSVEHLFGAEKYIAEQGGKTFPYTTIEEFRNAHTEPFSLNYDRCGFNWAVDKDFIFSKFIEYNDQHNHIPMMKGIDHVIKSLAGRDIILGVVTQNSGIVVKRNLETYDILHYFRGIVSHEDVKNMKPDPEGINSLLGSFGVTPEETVYVGDMPNDVKTAKNAHVHSMSYLGGFGTMPKFRELTPEEFGYTVFINSHSEILRLIPDMK